MAASKMFRVEINRWPDGSYGIVTLDLDDPAQGLDPLAVFEVRATSRSKIAPLVVAHLLGADTTHDVMRIR